VPASELSSLDDLLKPAFKGKIAIYEPREANNGSLQLADILQNKSDAFVRELLQDATYVDSPAQLVDFVASGRYPIGIGNDPERLEKLQSEGLGRDVEVTNITSHAAAAGIAVLQNAPHPNAAAILVNWFLSQEGQEAYARDGETTTRRTDAHSYIGDSPSYSLPDWDHLDKYVRTNEWQGIPLVDRVNEIAKEVKR
jgi:iron(III) transport system substrate-binding protein